MNLLKTFAGSINDLFVTWEYDVQVWLGIPKVQNGEV